jgi:hypothetical protein
MIAQAIAADRAQQLAAAVPPAGAAPVPFAVTPAGAGVAPWDLTSPQGTKLFLSVTAPIVPVFTGDQGDLGPFLSAIWNRMHSLGVSQVLMVPDDDGVPQDLTRHYGCLTEENMKTQALAYLQTQTRAHQAAIMLATLVKGSCSANVLSELSYREQHYTIRVPQPNGAADEMIQDGPSMLFDLITMVSVETKSTVGQLTNQLSNLQPIMEQEKSNVQAFNKKVQDIKAALVARRAPVPDLLIALFNGYLSCGDHAFMEFIKRKQNEYEEDKRSTLASEQLMQMALEKYKTIVGRGEWMQKSAVQLDMIAMQGTIMALQGQLKQNAAPANNKDKKTPGKSAARNSDNKFAWKLVAPKAGESHEKTVEGKAYIYCPHHAATKWVLKINREGIEHKTGCKMMVAGQQPVAAVSVAESKTDKLVAAVANVMMHGQQEEEEDP